MDAARFASSFSLLAESADAEREALEGLLDGLGGARPDLLTVFLTHHHGATFDGLARRLKQATGANLLIGTTGESIVGTSREIERQPAIALWAASVPGLEARPFHLTARGGEAGEVTFSDPPPIPDEEGSSLLLFGDPFTFPMVEFLENLNETHPGVPAAGGMASGGAGPGQHMLFLGDRELEEGAVGVHFGPDSGLTLRTVVSQGCRPVGRPWVITKCKQNLILKLGGKPAGQILIETLQELEGEDQRLFQAQPFIGLAVDASRQTFRRSDFLVRGIMGLQRQLGALAVADNTLRNGMTIQFLVRDAASAGEDLSQLLGEALAERPGAVVAPNSAGALLFSCNGRGTRMFPTESHDIGCVQSAFGGGVPAAGFFANGEIGPVGNRNFLHGFTASVALFHASE